METITDPDFLTSRQSYSSQHVIADTALGGFNLLNEKLTFYAWLGAACIIAGILVAELIGDD